MNSDEARTEIVEAELEGGQTIRIQATSLGGQERVVFDLLPFKEVTDALEGIARSVMATLEKVKPRKATVEFGLEIGVESGKLTAIIVKGSGTANLKITMEWGADES
jgi:Trypsin-co-occurring domain 1